MFARPIQLIIIEPDFPCLADEIAEPRPDMNVKLTAFTVSEKSIIGIYTTLTNFSTKYLVMCKVYTDVGGI